MKLPIYYQRFEAAAIFLAGIYFYFHLKFSLVWFIVLLFAIDLFMVGYLVNNRVGAHLYNIGHSLLIPVALLMLGAVSGERLFVGLGLIWLVHVGGDRALGYGLKLPSGFNDTHLGVIGKKRPL